MMMKKGNRVDLGIVYVVSQGHRDIVCLAHNDLKAFTVTCEEGGDGCRIKFNAKFLAYPETQWKAVFEVYSGWKRRQMPHLKLPNHSGLTRGGRAHPWRVKVPTKRDEVFDEDLDPPQPTMEP